MPGVARATSTGTQPVELTELQIVSPGNEVNKNTGTFRTTGRFTFVPDVMQLPG
jgi:hypothetical protein